MKAELKNGEKTFYAKDRKAWRRWLATHHAKEKSIWLIMYHKSSDTPSIYYPEAVEEALCYGWIDSTAYKRDDESKYQYFTQRKPKSAWSKVNRDRVDKLVAEGKMTSAGQAFVDLAKKTGTWEAMMDIENNVIPDDLQKQFNKNKTAFKNFQAFAPSSRKIILTWIQSAKRPETRKQRVEQAVELASRNIKANHYVKKG